MHKRNKVRLLTFWFIFCILFSCGSIYAEEKIPIEITGDKVEYLSAEKRMEAVGNAKLIYEDTVLTCDRLSLDVASNMAYAEGNVTVHQDKTVLTGDSIVYNLATKTGEASKIGVESDIVFGKGEAVEKLSDRELQLRRGHFSTCDLDSPHYRIWAKKLLIYPGDRVVAKNAFFYLGKAPVFYLPQYVQYLHDDRPKVTVMPGKEKNWGLFVLSKWRYQFNDGAKGVVLFDWREKRDIAWGFDFYYKPEDFGEDWGDVDLGSGYFKTYYMNERKIQRSHLWKKYRPHDVTFEKERFRIRWAHEWDIAPDTLAVWEYNRLKDQDFMKDYFYRDEYERDIQPDTYLLVTRTKPEYTLSLLERKRVDRSLSVSESQPEIKLEIRNQPVFGMQTFYEEDGSLGSVDDYEDIYAYAEAHGVRSLEERIIDPYFESTTTFASTTNKNAHSDIDDDVITLDTYNALSFPKRFFYISFSPSVAIQETFYSKDINGDPIHSPVAVFSTGASVSTRFFRIFGLNTNFLNLDINDLRHIITPSVDYGYVNEPTMESSRLIGGGGDSGGSHTVELSLENKLQTKRDNKTVDVLRFITEADYDIYTPGRAGWSDIEYDLEIIPYPNSRFEMDAEYDTQAYVFKNVNFDITAQSDGSKYEDVEIFGNDWSWGVGYRYERKGSRQLTTAGEYRLNPKWKFKVYESFELARSKDLREQEYSIYRDLHCWVVQLTYNVTREYGEGIWLTFRLKAFPEMGIDFENSYHQPKLRSQSIAYEDR